MDVADELSSRRAISRTWSPSLSHSIQWFLCNVAHLHVLDNVIYKRLPPTYPRANSAYIVVNFDKLFGLNLGFSFTKLVQTVLLQNYFKI